MRKTKAAPRKKTFIGNSAIVQVVNIDDSQAIGIL
jgi:hypothetical protein